MERRKVHNYWKSKYLCNISILYYKLDIFLIFIKKSTFLSYIYKGHGVKGPIPHCRGLRGPKGPPVLCKKMQEDAGPGWNLPELSWFQTKDNIHGNPSEALWGGGKFHEQRVVHYVNYVILYLSAKIYCR